MSQRLGQLAWDAPEHFSAEFKALRESPEFEEKFPENKLEIARRHFLVGKLVSQLWLKGLELATTKEDLQSLLEQFKSEHQEIAQGKFLEFFELVAFCDKLLHRKESRKRLTVCYRTT